MKYIILFQLQYLPIMHFLFSFFWTDVLKSHLYYNNTVIYTWAGHTASHSLHAYSAPLRWIPAQCMFSMETGRERAFLKWIINSSWLSKQIIHGHAQTCNTDKEYNNNNNKWVLLFFCLRYYYVYLIIISLIIIIIIILGETCNRQNIIIIIIKEKQQYLLLLMPKYATHTEYNRIII